MSPRGQTAITNADVYRMMRRFFVRNEDNGTAIMGRESNRRVALSTMQPNYCQTSTGGM